MRTLTLVFILSACGSPSNDPAPKVEPPTAETVMVSVSDTLAVFVSKSSSNINGLCWSNSPNPTKSNNWAEGDTVTFSTQARQKYHVRAFGQNGAGTVYGNEITFLAVCPSDLGGTYNYITEIVYTSGLGFCNSTITGTVTLTDQGNGLYAISDASFGVYACAWGDSPAVGIILEDTCGELDFRGVDQYGLEYTFSLISPLKFQWTNEYGDSAITTLQ